MLAKIKTFIIPISAIVVAVLIVGVFLYLGQSKTKILSAKEVGDLVMKYIKANVNGGDTASLTSIVQDGDVYKLQLSINGQTYDSYASRDGKLLFPSGYSLVEATSTTQNQSDNSSSTNPQIPKADKPDVKLFVMSYCPYGLQAEKMYLPVYNLLKDKTDMGVYFVDYIMHGKQELDENLRQYCIQKDQKDKYSAYLSCFAATGNSDTCLTQANINKDQVDNCVFDTDSTFKITTSYNHKETWLSGTYPLFDVEKDLNQKYSVQGSPTIVINDQEVDVSPRSPEKFKEIVCQTFNNQPAECSQTLSNETPATGIGSATTTGSASTGNAACGQ